LRDIYSVYQQKLTTPQNAVAKVPRKCNLSFGLGPSNPPALLASLAKRVDAGDVDEIHLFYQLAKDGAKPLFKTKYLDRLRFHANFMTDLDRALIKEAGTSAVIDFMPGYLWQLPRIFSEYNHIDAFMITVAPMDKHG
jgi:itaconate CoA-transferase